MNKLADPSHPLGLPDLVDGVGGQDTSRQQGCWSSSSRSPRPFRSSPHSRRPSWSPTRSRQPSQLSARSWRLSLLSPCSLRSSWTSSHPQGSTSLCWRHWQSTWRSRIWQKKATQNLTLSYCPNCRTRLLGSYVSTSPTIHVTGHRETGHRIHVIVICLQLQKRRPHSLEQWIYPGKNKI